MQHLAQGLGGFVLAEGTFRIKEAAGLKARCVSKKLTSLFERLRPECPQSFHSSRAELRWPAGIRCGLVKNPKRELEIFASGLEHGCIRNGLFLFGIKLGGPEDGLQVFGVAGHFVALSLTHQSFDDAGGILIFVIFDGTGGEPEILPLFDLLCRAHLGQAVVFFDGLMEGALGLGSIPPPHCCYPSDGLLNPLLCVRCALKFEGEFVLRNQSQITLIFRLCISELFDGVCFCFELPRFLIVLINIPAGGRAAEEYIASAFLMAGVLQHSEVGRRAGQAGREVGVEFERAEPILSVRLQLADEVIGERAMLANLLIRYFFEPTGGDDLSRFPAVGFTVIVILDLGSGSTAEILQQVAGETGIRHKEDVPAFEGAHVALQIGCAEPVFLVDRILACIVGKPETDIVPGIVTVACVVHQEGVVRLEHV